MEQRLYDYSPIVDRPPLRWPDGARVAFYLALNIEHFRLDRPATSASPGTVGLVPDPMNYGWRDYGVRVGVWRTIELLDRLEIPASVPLNSDVCRCYPQIVEAGLARDWVWLAHGQTNSIRQAAMEPADERAYLGDMVQTLTSALGAPPRGWLGPGMTETLQTPHLLAELGLDYVLDWCNDDQPYPLNVPGLLAVPYAVELNDILLFVGRNLSGDDYIRLVIDHLDQLLADGAATGRVMALAVHPFVSGQPSRHRHLARVLEEVRSREGVWITTSDAIADHYRASVAPAALRERA